MSKKKNSVNPWVVLRLSKSEQEREKFIWFLPFIFFTCFWSFSLFLPLWFGVICPLSLIYFGGKGNCKATSLRGEFIATSIGKEPFTLGDNDTNFFMISEMVCMVTNVTVHTWRQEKVTKSYHVSIERQHKYRSDPESVSMLQCREWYRSE